MASPAQGFRRRVKDRAVREEQKTISFFLETTDEDEEGNEFVVRHDDFTAATPTEEQLMLVFAQAGREDSSAGDEVAAVLQVFKDVLPRDQYRVLIARFRDPEDVDVDSDALLDIFRWLMEQWQDFPTKQPSDSSGSRASSGARSTGRAPGKGSTH